MGFKRLFYLMSVLSLSFILACASTRMSNRAADRFFRRGNFESAAIDLEKGLKEVGDGRDQLLYLLDLGLVAHTAQKLKESNRYFLKAEKIAEIKDYTSLGTEAATLFTSDNIKDYKGEDFEKVLINVYLAMNFSELNLLDDALVEARKVNRILRRMIREGSRKYELSAFAMYLSGVLYETKGEYDNAYISYKQILEQMPIFPLIGYDLWRMAYALRRRSEQRKWADQFNLSQADQDKNKKRVGSKRQSELIVFFENGISPIKKSHRRFGSIPIFQPRFNPVTLGQVMVNGEQMDDTALLDNIESKAIHNLEQKYAGLIAKKIAGAAAKIIIGNQVEKATDSKLLGALTKIAFFISDQADVRSWNLLPKELQIARISLAPGTYRVRVRPVGDNQKIKPKQIKLKAGEKAFLSFRYIPR